MTNAKETRIERLKKMALERGCELFECSNTPHIATPSDELTYLMQIGEYPDPVEFDDLDQVEFDLNSREIVL